MVNPVTGPITRTSRSPDEYSVGSFYKTRRLYKQVKPYNLPLPYLLQTRTTENGYATTTATGDGWGGHWLGNWWTTTGISTTRDRCHDVPRWEGDRWTDLARRRDDRLNRARARFMGEANQRVALAIDALQLGQTYKLMMQNLQTLKEFALALKSKNPRKVGRALGLLKRHPRRSPFGSYSIAPSDWRSLSADLGSLWLMYSYGWKPFIEDIYNASQILSAPIEPLWINHSSHEEINLHETQTVVDGTSIIKNSNTIKGKIFARVGGVVQVKNLNLHTAKNAGFTNPASWLWEMIPFSFVVDWFFSFGEWVNSLDDQVGLSITDGYYTVGMRGTSHISTILVRPLKGWPATTGRRAGDGGWKRRQFAQVTRSRGVPPVKLVRRAKVLTNVNRGLNASSLLAQLLRNSSEGLNVEGKPLPKKKFYTKW